MRLLKKLREWREKRRERLNRAIDRYRKTGEGGLIVRRHQKALRKIRRGIRKIRNAPRELSGKGAAFICGFESHVSTPTDIGDGVTSIGPGIVLHTGPPTHADRNAVWIKGQDVPGHLSPEEGQRFLRRYMAGTFAPVVARLFDKDGPLHGMFTQEFFDGLCSVAWNLGTGSVTPGTPGFETLGAAIEARSRRKIADALLLYINPGSKFEEGLLRRRRAEGQLILFGNYGK